VGTQLQSAAPGVSSVMPVGAFSRNRHVACGEPRSPHPERMPAEGIPRHQADRRAGDPSGPSTPSDHLVDCIRPRRVGASVCRMRASGLDGIGHPACVTERSSGRCLDVHHGREASSGPGSAGLAGNVAACWRRARPRPRASSRPDPTCANRRDGDPRVADSRHAIRSTGSAAAVGSLAAPGDFLARAGRGRVWPGWTNRRTLQFSSGAVRLAGGDGVAHDPRRLRHGRHGRDRHHP
jgi:hypothetical protein